MTNFLTIGGKEDCPERGESGISELLKDSPMVQKCDCSWPSKICSIFYLKSDQVACPCEAYFHKSFLIHFTRYILLNVFLLVSNISVCIRTCIELRTNHCEISFSSPQSCPTQIRFKI